MDHQTFRFVHMGYFCLMPAANDCVFYRFERTP